MNITPELLEDYMKSRDDITYFAETHIKIMHPTHGLIPFKLNDFQRDTLETYKSKNVFAKFAPRQAGKTILASVIILHRALFNRDQVSAIVARNFASSNYILEFILELYNNLPSHLKEKLITNNKTKLGFDNGCTILSVGANAKTFRGIGLTNIYVDESEFIPDFTEMMYDLHPMAIPRNNGKVFAFTSTRTSEYFKE